MRPLIMSMKKDKSKETKKNDESETIQFELFELDENVKEFMNSPMDCALGEFSRESCIGPLTWELHRPEKDAYFT